MKILNFDGVLSQSISTIYLTVLNLIIKREVYSNIVHKLEIKI